jgi:transposase-like protein
MGIKGDEPKTLLEAIRHFSDADVCLDFMVSLRWPDGIVKCPTCGSEKVTFMASRRVWQCKTKHPKRQFSVKVGTIFEDSPIGLDKWFAVIWMLANDKNGISSYEVSRAVGVTQKTAWFMQDRIRLTSRGRSIRTAWRTSGAFSSGPSMAPTSESNPSTCSATLTSKPFDSTTGK